MRCIFIGGPLDGERREVPDASIRDGVATYLGNVEQVQVLDRFDYVQRQSERGRGGADAQGLARGLGGEASNRMNDFRECDTCRAKPGTPILCNGCLSNRKLIGELQEKLKAIADYCAREAAECDPFCCREYLNEIAALAQPPGA